VNDTRPPFVAPPARLSTDVRECVREYREKDFAAFNHWTPHQATHPGARHWHPPPLRAHYRRQPPPALPAGAPWALEGDARPLVVIHNKHNVEWGEPPVNTLSLELLASLLALLRPLPLRLAYARPVGAAVDDSGSAGVPFQDGAWLREHAADVLLLDDVAAANADSLTLNEVQLRLYARADHAIAVQGGPALFLAQFLGAGGDLVVLHKRGGEAGADDGNEVDEGAVGGNATKHGKRGSEYATLFSQFDGAAVTVTRSEAALLAAVARLAPLWAVE
jgi:hypothetical protein